MRLSAIAFCFSPKNEKANGCHVQEPVATRKIRKSLENSGIKDYVGWILYSAEFQISPFSAPVFASILTDQGLAPRSWASMRVLWAKLVG